DGTNIDDLAAATRDHPPRHSLPDGEDRSDVGPHDLLKLFSRKIFERGAELHAGIVDEDIDRPELGFDIADPVGDALGIGDVEGYGLHIRPFAGQALSRPAQRLGVAAVEDDRGAGASESLGDTEADAAAGTGDEGAPAGKIEQ